MNYFMPIIVYRNTYMNPLSLTMALTPNVYFTELLTNNTMKHDDLKHN